MRIRTSLTYDGVRGQCVVLLLATLQDLGGRSTSRQVAAWITEQRFFDLDEEDRLPYPAAPEAEPRWEVLLAWAGKDCITGGCVTEDEIAGCWQLTSKGARLYRDSVKQFQKGAWDVRRCYLWTERFKKRFLKDYVPGPQDARRPNELYHGIERRALAAVFG